MHHPCDNTIYIRFFIKISLKCGINSITFTQHKMSKSDNIYKMTSKFQIQNQHKEKRLNHEKMYTCTATVTDFCIQKQNSKRKKKKKNKQTNQYIHQNVINKQQDKKKKK